MGASRPAKNPASPSAEVQWAYAVELFLRRDLATGSRRIYKLTLDRVQRHLDGDDGLATITPDRLARAVSDAYPAVSPATWNRVIATVRSFAAFCRRQGWIDTDLTVALERRRTPADYSRSLPATELGRLFTRRGVPLRERALWRLLYETAARANEVLSLNIEDLNLPARRAVTTGKGGGREVLHFATGSARLLPRLIEGRTSGPVFLADRPSAPTRTPALADLDPLTGRARLSYRRAAELFTSASGGATLHQLRHAALTHLAEAGVPTVLLMAKSRHASLRSLQRYARPGVEAVAQLTAAHDPAQRRRR